LYEELEGKNVQFDYNDLHRKGKVEAVTPSYIVVELKEDKDGRPYKSFAKHRISNLKVER